MFKGFQPGRCSHGLSLKYFKCKKCEDEKLNYEDAMLLWRGSSKSLVMQRILNRVFQTK